MKRILLSLFASAICAAAFAIPARPGIFAFTQPDGSVVNIKMVGDEHAHLIYSEGGMLLVNVDGRLEYAQFDKNGIPVGSGIIANPDNELFAKSLNLQTKENIEKWGEELIADRDLRINRRASIRKSMASRAGEEDAENLVPKNFGRWDVPFPVIGDQKGLVILAEFEDVQFQYGDYDYFNRMLNEEGFSDFGSLGSARDWFISNSNGQFRPQFDVYGPVKLPKEHSYYGKNTYKGRDHHAYEMIIDLCDALDDEVDFSQYDRDGDGIIDYVFVFYAGSGEHESGVEDDIWPQSWDIFEATSTSHFYDHVLLNQYACTCEYRAMYDRADGIGTFVHEFSHVMGLPDLYATVLNFEIPFTPGPWSVLANGPYNNNALTPPNYSSFEKCALGWTEFQPLTEGIIELPEWSESNVAYALPTEKDTEFYFFENRQQVGNDQFLPNHGMLVWHVAYKDDVWKKNAVNNIPLRQYVDIIEADNEKTEETRDGDVFPGTMNVTSFGFHTLPKLASWNKKLLAFDIEDITETEDGLITFNAVATGTPDAVGEIETKNEKAAVYYDLMGRRVDNPEKGIYIMNGKKVVK